jgi:catalase-peroxidase
MPWCRRCAVTTVRNLRPPPSRSRDSAGRTASACGNGGDAISQRHRGRLETEPDQMGHGLSEHAVQIRVGAGQEPGRRASVAGQGRGGADMVVDAHDPSKKHRPMMTTADLSLRNDPIYEPIARRYQQNPEIIRRLPLRRAWFKLTTATWDRARAISVRWSLRRAHVARPRPRGHS